MNSRWILVAATAASLGPGAVNAASLDTALDGLTKISFGTESLLAIGDTIDVLDPAVPHERCIEFSPDAIKADTEGSTASQLSFTFVRDADDFENTFKVSYSVEAASSANLLSLVSGSSSLTGFGSFESFLRTSSESALLVIEASAQHGRDLIQDFRLKEPYQSLIDKKEFAKFRASCGTHFIRGWSRRSSIRVVIQISNVDREAKVVIESTLSGSLGASVGLGDLLSASTNVKMSSSLADTLKLASRLGKISARVEATGGAGVGTIVSLVKEGDLTDPAFLSKLLTTLAETAKDFSRANSAPDAFVVVSHPAVPAAAVSFDAVDYDKLGELFKYIVRVDQRLALYEEYKSRDFALWDRYFRVYTEQVSRLRSELIGAYQQCKTNGVCEISIASEVDGLILDDVLPNGSLDAVCVHAFSHSDQIGGSEAEKFSYLSSIILVWKSGLNFAGNVDLESAEVFVVTPDFSLSEVAFDPARQQSVRLDENADTGDLMIDLYRENVDRTKVIDADGELSVDALRELRKRVGQSVYGLRFQSNNGLELEEVLGRPNMQDCPVYISD